MGKETSVKQIATKAHCLRKCGIIQKQGEPSYACCLLYAGFLLGFIFNPEDGGNMFLQYIG
jgi:hypothetical protein